MSEAELQAVIAEMEQQRNFFQMRCMQFVQELAKSNIRVGELQAALAEVSTPVPTT